MQQIDSLQMSINTGESNQYGEPILIGIDNAIESMTGELMIDDPNNKSGLERYPQYPTFTSRDKSYIYFDSPDIQNGVYDRNSFISSWKPLPSTVWIISDPKPLLPTEPLHLPESCRHWKCR